MKHRTLERILSDVPFLESGALMAQLVLPDCDLDVAAAEPARWKQIRDEYAPKAVIRDDGVAVIEITGTLAAKPDLYEIIYYGFTDSLEVGALIERTAKDPSVKGLLLNWDSPGGYLTGGPEVADAIAKAAKTKPVVSWTGGQMASLAYWMASQSTFIAASTSARVGSVGVYIAVPDLSERYKAAGVKVEVFRNVEAIYKAAGVPGTTLSDDHKRMLQESAQTSFEEFKAAILRARPQAKAEAMQGQVFGGAQSEAMGLVDFVGSMASASANLRARIKERNG